MLDGPVFTDDPRNKAICKWWMLGNHYHGRAQQGSYGKDFCGGLVAKAVGVVQPSDLFLLL